MRLETINDIDTLDGPEFEYLCADVLRKIGFSRVTVTGSSGDFGVDILAEKNGEKYAIQCKRWDSKVTNKAVQEVLSGKTYYGCKYAAVLTNSYFNKHAVETARGTNVIMWDRNALITMIKKAYPDSISFSEKRSSGSSKNAWLAAIVAAAILLVAVLSMNNKPASQKQNAGTGKLPTMTASSTAVPQLPEKPSSFPLPAQSSIPSFDGKWELMVADEHFDPQYEAGWPRRIIDTRAGTITINWADSPKAYEYEVLSSGKLAFSYYWAAYTTSFYEEIEAKDGKIVSTIWYKGTDTPCLYCVYEADG